MIGYVFNREEPLYCPKCFPKSQLRSTISKYLYFNHNKNNKLHGCPLTHRANIHIYIRNTMLNIFEYSELRTKQKK